MSEHNAIELNNLHYAYPDGRQALHGISLVVRQGEKVGLIGPNGAGKSTLLLHLNGLLRSDGAVKVLGVPVAEKSLNWVRSRVGLVFQEPEDQLFSPTVFDDVAFGPLNLGCSAEEVCQRVAQALQRVGLNRYEGRSPHHLSVGEKKRVALASVLAMNPQILALDEPTANLDPRAKWRLVELLRQLDLTLIVASHDLDIIRELCQRTIVLDEGKVVADDLTPRILSHLSLLQAHGLAPVREAEASTPPERTKDEG